MSIGSPLNTPLREALSSYGTWSGMLPVAVDGVGYLVDLRPEAGFSRNSLDVLNGRPNRTKGQLALVPNDVWWEIRETWDAGSGQRYGDRDESLQNRYFNGVGVDPWDKWSISLLPDTRNVLPSTALDGNVHLATLGKEVGADSYQPWLVAAVSESLFWTSDLTGTPTWTEVATGSAITSMTSDGDAVWTTHADGTVRRCDGPTATPEVKATLSGADFVGYAKGHVLVGADNTLWDVTFGTPQKVGADNPLPAWRWRSVVEGPGFIYALGGVGDRWAIHKIGVNVSSDGTTNDVLTAPVVAVQLPDGEVGRSLGAYLGFVTVGSDQGFRLGLAEANGDITLGRLVETAGPVFGFEGQDRFVWYTNTGFDPDGAASGLGRLDLTTFTAPLTPAYANDLSAKVNGTSFNVATFQGKRVFSVTGYGVYVEDDVLVVSGWFETGQLSWGTMDNKIALYTQVKHEPLFGTVETLVSFDQSDWVSVFVDAGQGGLGGKNMYLQSVVFSTMGLRLQLARSSTDAAKGPVVTRVEARVFPNAGRASEWVLPLVLWDTVEWDGAITNRNPRRDLDELISMVESGRVVTYREASRGWQVNVTDYQWKPEKPSLYGGWQGVCTIRMREVR